MPNQTYQKLVRDRIPEIIREDGKICITQVLSETCYLEMLDSKLAEELTEYQESKSLEELADFDNAFSAVEEGGEDGETQ